MRQRSEKAFQLHIAGDLDARTKHAGEGHNGFCLGVKRELGVSLLYISAEGVFDAGGGEG